jgi:ANTAR domain
MSSRHDRNDAGAQPRTGRGGVPGDAQDNGTIPVTDADTGPFQAVERTPSGWRVGDEELPDLTSAMVLADILNAELTADEQAELDAAGASGAPPAPSAQSVQPQDAAGRNSGQIAGAQTSSAPTSSAETPSTPAPSAPAPSAPVQDYPREPRGRRAARRGAHRAGPRGGTAADVAETEQLKATVAQLERALTVRVRVEQAIGVLAERHRIRPRQAFELLRSASRARGQRIMETASQVIASASNPLLRLPEELAKPPMPRRMPRRSRGEA